MTSSAIPAGSALTELETPAVLVDLDRLTRNLDRMASYADSHKLALRPHIKTHKASTIAAAQLARGAAGLTVATPAEAGVMSAVCGDILLAYPAIGPKLGWAWNSRLSCHTGVSPATLCSGDPITMFFTDMVATTALWVFSMAELMMYASGSNMRAARRTGIGRMLRSTMLKTSYFLSRLRSTRLTCSRLYSGITCAYLKLSKPSSVSAALDSTITTGPLILGSR